ncbi:MAG: membrane protein insertion efficiency factor YidD [Candidatus Gracilibacteria bacterium]
MVTLLQLLIRLYQVTLSPDHSWLRHIFPGGFCRFTPSCSAYTHEAIGKYGAIRGSLKGLWRILRCNPWSKGGLDLPGQSS